MKIREIKKSNMPELYPNELIGLSEIEYKIGDVFKNSDEYYFEVVAMKTIFDINVLGCFVYHLCSIGDYKTLSKYNKSLRDFNLDMVLVTDNNQKDNANNGIIWF